MKTTLKKLIFNDNFTKHDLIKRLMDGESFKYIKPDKAREGAQTVRAKHLHYDKSHTNNPFRLDTNAWDFLGLKYLHEEVTIQWWEDPEAVGKPCKFWNLSETPVIGRFLLYHADHRSFEMAAGYMTYDNCEPLTADDLYQGDV